MDKIKYFPRKWLPITAISCEVDSSFQSGQYSVGLYDATKSAKSPTKFFPMSY